MAKIKSGEQIRMLSSGFLHVDFNHLLVNMLSLYFFAGYVVYSLGEMKFLALYLSSLYLGNYLSFRYHNREDNYTAVGASGAVSGVVYSAVLLYPDMKMILIFFPIPLPGYVMAALYMRWLPSRWNEEPCGQYWTYRSFWPSGLLATISLFM